MNAGLRAFLEQLIDYAGLFPPAKLLMDEAIRNYAAYQKQPDAWMLGRFICPAARLGELSPFVETLFTDESPLSISALGRSGGDPVEFSKGLDADLAAIEQFRKTYGKRVVVDVFEVRLPVQSLLPAEASHRGSALTESAVRSGMAVFCEAPATPDLLPDQLGKVGFKLRCGGLESSAFPSSEQIARALVACRKAGVPFKATAGLHHPFPRWDDGVKARMHGFVNVFAALLFNAKADQSVETLTAILDDAEPGNFLFSDDGLRWHSHFQPTEAIVQARKQFAVSFGSCSFDEPRDDLRAIGFLPR